MWGIILHEKLNSMYQSTHPSPATADKESDYVDIENHDEYVDPEELMQGEGSAPEPSTPRSPIPVYKPLPSELRNSMPSFFLMVQGNHTYKLLSRDFACLIH